MGGHGGRALRLIAGIAAFAGTADAAGIKKFAVDLPPLVVVRSLKPAPLGTERTVKEGDVLLSARLGIKRGGMVRAGRSVSVQGLSFGFPAASVLPAVTARGGDLTGKASDVLCDQPQDNRRKELPPQPKVNGRDQPSPLDRTTQLCLVDTDGDKRMDHAFLVGTKLDSDRHLIAIDPVEYETAENIPLDRGSVLAVVYYDGGLLRGPNLEIQAALFGHPLDLQSVRFGPGKTEKSIGWKRSIKRDALPDTVRLGTAQLSVLAVDPTAKTATIRYDRDFTPTEFAYELKVHVTYIYIAH